MRHDYNNVEGWDMKNENRYMTKEQIIDNFMGIEKEYGARYVYLCIKRFMESGMIAKVDNDLYKVVNKKSYLMDREYDGTKAIIDLLFSHYPFLDFVVYNITYLNEWLNQTIGKGTFFIEAPKEAIVSIYEKLIVAGYNNILINPKVKELKKYVSGNIIVLKPLFSRSPIIKKTHSLTIEKIIVDLYCDDIFELFFAKSELIDVYRQIFSEYAIDEVSLNAYLSRRNIKDRFYDFLEKNDLRKLMND